MPDEEDEEIHNVMNHNWSMAGWEYTSSSVSREKKSKSCSESLEERVDDHWYWRGAHQNFDRKRQ